MEQKAPGVIFVYLLVAVLAAIAAALAVGMLAGCAGDRTAADPQAGAPPLSPATWFEIPPSQRVVNYGRGGSCMYAAAEDVLAWQGRLAEADYWRSHFRGGSQYPIEAIARTAKSRGLQVAYTTTGDEEFLQHCAEQRLGAMIRWQVDDPGDHAIVFCGYDGAQAVLLGTDFPETVRMPKAKFLAIWHRCGGEALTFLPKDPSGG
jgi:hypothetical protein